MQMVRIRLESRKVYEERVGVDLQMWKEIHDDWTAVCKVNGTAGEWTHTRFSGGRRKADNQNAQALLDARPLPNFWMRVLHGDRWVDDA